jgi:hypothetical protein
VIAQDDCLMMKKESIRWSVVCYLLIMRMIPEGKNESMINPLDFTFTKMDICMIPLIRMPLLIDHAIDR